ncbi:hypothetical protein CVIRNUC_000946 [Coccomyxa viridis]|uniref:Urea active transporter 1 n=1 Tax=Coccomyxa viridis TaxID=1274662 RepID=A0AAV1HRS4_9CHLO|nr:hypothetical protein CVIRNUC_000946 [Coccomyxa viridis]
MPVDSQNLFGLHQYDGNSSFFSSTETVLSQGVGYGILVGFGAFFALICSGLAYFDVTFAGHKDSSEHFQTASRNIKTGLIAVDVVSHWTWSITLLQSSTVAWNYGVSGPFWYSAGAVLQIMLFGIMAIQIKRKAPNCHTILEVVRLRWGRAAHLVFLYLFLINNLFITSSLIIGSGAVIHALTGVSQEASSMLIPLSVLVYCVAGGIKAVFTSSYLHSAIIYVAVVLFSIYVYSGSNGHPISSIGKVYDNLKARSAAVPVPSNKDGSILTLFSGDGLEFGFIFFARGYILGGLMWFAVPFTLATTLGLTGLALDLPLAAKEVASGLVPPAVAYHLFGKGGVILITIMVFMAVTSSGSAEFMAVSSLFSYDIYKTYIRPKAAGREMLIVSRLSVLTFALFAGVWSIILIKIGIDINWLFFVIGLLVASVFPPISFLLIWNAVPKGAAITAALGGQACAIITWLVATQQIYGKLSIITTAASGPSLAGNLAAIVVSATICIVWTLIAPDRNASWEMLRQDLRTNIEVLDDAQVIDDEKEDLGQMAHAYKLTWIWAITLSIVIFVLWPLLALPAGIFSRGYFTFWVILSMIWGLVAGAIAIFLPLYEAKEIAKAVFGFGKLADTRKRKAVARNTEVPSKPSPDNSLRAHDVELGEHKPANGSTATLKI